MCSERLKGGREPVKLCGEPARKLPLDGYCWRCITVCADGGRVSTVRVTACQRLGRSLGAGNSQGIPKEFLREQLMERPPPAVLPADEARAALAPGRLVADKPTVELLLAKISKASVSGAARASLSAPHRTPRHPFVFYYLFFRFGHEPPCLVLALSRL